ncbi:hypothetical protein [Castellaniella caeni]|uniref:hypothetical protein n=1 Tax=Castellaniella caeni TaxID=266123 RepID=UPI000C9ECDE4|nr:hypothetical protein [Castellaniella caeni]
MKDLLIKEQQRLQPGWAWRTRQGDHVQPRDMETRHLFFTLRMIWHNTMPRDAWVMAAPKLYRFGPSYTNEYLLEGIKHLTAELSARRDMQPEWADQLRRMIGYFAKMYAPVQVTE